MRTSRIPPRFLLSLSSLLLVTAVASPQAPPPDPGIQPPEAGFVDTVRVDVVNVDVYVTDKKGKRITGLTRDDFEVFEDGRPVEVTNFYAVEGAEGPAAVAEETPERVAPPLPRLAPQEPEIPEDQRLYLVIFVDNFNIRPPSRARVLRDLRAFVRDTVQPADRVMVVTYDPSLHIRRSFTNDPVGVVNSLFETGELVTSAVNSDLERRSVLDDIDDAEDLGRALLYARSYADSVFNDLQFTIDALREIVHSLGGVPGRKAILHVSDGIPAVAGEDVFYAVDEKFGSTPARLEAFGYDTTTRFREVTTQANANRITFYTIDARGLEVSPAISAQESDIAISSSIEYIRNANLTAPLHLMADQTGGKAIVGTNAIAEGLRDVAADFRSYYSLGYRPASAGDGRFHEIEVRAKGRKDLVLRHRRGYRAKTAEALMAEGALAALLYSIEKNLLGATLTFEAPVRRDDGKYLVPVLTRIPIGRLALIPRGGVHEGRVRLTVAAMDFEGELSPIQQQSPVTIRIPAVEVEVARQKDYVYEVQLLMRPGTQRVAVGIRDAISGQTSFVTRAVEVGERAGRR